MNAIAHVQHETRLLLIAVEFFTRIPVPAWIWREGWEPGLLNRSARYFPLVGGLVGVLTGGVLVGGLSVLPVDVAVLLSMLSGFFITGAFHEDGWADSCDGFGGGSDRAQVLEIMKDSRIGSYACVGLWSVLTLKFTLLAELVLSAGAVVFYMVISAHAVSRLSALWVMVRLTYVRDQGPSKSKPIAQEISLPEFAFAAALTYLVSLPVGPTVAVVAVVTALVVSESCASWIERRLGGYVGDALGGVQQLTEAVVLLVFLMSWRWTFF